MSQETPETGPVDATAVREAKFQLIRRGGYDPAQVDPFLELIALTLEGGPGADPRLNSDYIHGVRFTTVRRGGYLPTQVDRFLDRVIATFDQRATIPKPRQTAAPATPPATVAAAATAPEDGPPARPATATPPATVAPVSALPDAAPAATPPTPKAADGPEADFDRLRALHRSGVLSDKEFAVLGARVKRRINAPDPAAEVSV